MSLLEREHDLSVLGALLTRAAGGDGSVAVLVGPPGIGKTALLSALRRCAHPDVRVLKAVGGELDRDLPFGVVRQLFETTVRRGDGPDVLAGAARLAAPVFTAGDEQPATAALGDVVHGLYWLCANLADTAPMLLVVDDVHWSDDASLRFVSHLARRIEGLPILLLLAGRAGSKTDELIDRVLGGVEIVSVHPAPLSPDAVSTLVRQRLGGDADVAFCAACAVASGGNPFLLAEALDTLADEQVRPVAAEVDRVSRLRPQAIARSVLSRIGRLGADAPRFARALAILGPTATTGQLAGFAGLSPERAAAIADALARESIVGADRPVDFVHPLIRESVYGDLSEVQRVTEHKRAAHLLDASGATIDQVTAQLLATAPEADEWVVASLRRGAAAAIARGAPESAITHLTRAWAEPPRPDDRAAVEAELARAVATAGRLADAARLFRQAIEGTEGDAGKFALALELAVVLHRAGRSQDAVRAVERARRYVDWDDLDLPARLQGVLAVADFVAMKPPSVWTARLDHVARSHPGDHGLDRTVLAIRALGAAAMGDRTANEVASLAQRAAAGPVPKDDTGTLVVMAGSALTVSGHTAPALALLDAGIKNATASGNRAEFGYLSVVRSHIAWFAGRLRDAEADDRAALDEVAGEPRTLNASLAAALLVDALAERGDVAQAATVARDFALDEHVAGDAIIDHFVPMARGALRLAEHRPADALQDFLDCGKMLTSHGYTNPGFAQWRAGAIAAHAALGQIESATILAEEDLDLARKFEAPGPIALALRMSARIAPDGARLDRLAEAADILEGAPDLLERAHVLVEYGTELSRAGRRTAARNPLVQGLDLAGRFDARPLVAAAQRELRLIGIWPRRTAATGRDALTASELRVATLAAEGAANREIAQALFVTTRTIEVHLTSTYRKLGIEGRGQLATALTQPRLVPA